MNESVVEIKSVETSDNNGSSEGLCLLFAGELDIPTI